MKELITRVGAPVSVGLFLAAVLGAAGSAAASDGPDGAEPGAPAKAGQPTAGAVFTDCPKVCPEMIPLPLGTFDRGEPPTFGDPPLPTLPPETVVIERPFAIGRYEVTVGEYGAFVQETGATDLGMCQTDRGTVGPYSLDPQGSWSDPGFPQTERHPVVCVTVADAEAYAEWLSRKTGRRYRLPTEREWEFAFRSGRTGGFPPTGKTREDYCHYANIADASHLAVHPKNLTSLKCDDGYAYTAPVGSFPPNDFGIYDMIGNVSEWTSSAWGPQEAIARGGSWPDAPSLGNQDGLPRWDPKMRRPRIGFRVVRDM